MNSETIYNVLLDQPRSIDGRTWHGFSYQMQRDNDTGEVEVVEVGWPTRLTLWQTDGPELDTLDEVTVKGMIEAALPVDVDYVIPPPPVPYVPTYSPEDWTAKFFTAAQILALQRFEFALQQAGKPLGSNMGALKTWLEMMLLASADPTPRSDWQEPPCTYANAAAEAVAALQP